MRINRSISSLLFALLLLAVPALSPAQIAVGVSITIAPPALPVYVQPVCPAPGYIWTPGSWAYDPVDGYYWVPGSWVLAPSAGLLWTPGYWSWGGGVFVWNAGYWAPDVGFYGGINYGFGYFGVGYLGGYWNNGAFYYNRSVNNISANITNTYNKTVINNSTTINRVSYNGGNGGTTARATSAELAAARDPHRQATPLQMRQQQEARGNRAQFASVNHGQPAVAATLKPGVFSGSGVVRASRAGAPYNANRGPENRATARTTNGASVGAHPVTAERPSSATSRPTTKHEAAPEHEATSRPTTKHEAAPEHEATSRPTTKHEAAPEHEATSRPATKHEAAPEHAASRPPAQHPNAPRPEEKKPQ